MHEKVLPHTSKCHIVVRRQINEVVLEEVEISNPHGPCECICAHMYFFHVVSSQVLNPHRQTLRNLLNNHILTLVI